MKASIIATLGALATAKICEPISSYKGGAAPGQAYYCTKSGGKAYRAKMKRGVPSCPRSKSLCSACGDGIFSQGARVITFGDSLSDSGLADGNGYYTLVRDTFPESFPAFVANSKAVGFDELRQTNGPTWPMYIHDILAERGCLVDSVSYAQGAAQIARAGESDMFPDVEVPAFSAQIAKFLADDGFAVGGNKVFAYAGGANDVQVAAADAAAAGALWQNSFGLLGQFCAAGCDPSDAIFTLVSTLGVSAELATEIFTVFAGAAGDFDKLVAAAEGAAFAVASQSLAETVEKLVTDIFTLAAFGHFNVFVVETPKLQIAPIAQGNEEIITLLISELNSAVREQLAALLPYVKIITGDAAIDEIIADDKGLEMCFYENLVPLTPRAEGPPENCDAYAFVDPFHPTTEYYLTLAESIVEQLV